jgi:PadR family transcriptional regulator, regulatory protein PadR
LAKRYQNPTELLQGTVELFVLYALLCGPPRGYGLSQAIRLNSGDILHLDDAIAGVLDPARKSEL